jgi:hypothetical protein
VERARPREGRQPCLTDEMNLEALAADTDNNKKKKKKKKKRKKDKR